MKSAKWLKNDYICCILLRYRPKDKDDNSFQQIWYPFFQRCFFFKSKSSLIPGEMIRKLLFHHWLSLRKGVTLYFNKLEFPLPKDTLKLAKGHEKETWMANWFWRLFFKNDNVLYYFNLILPLRGRGPSFDKTLNLLNLRIHYDKFG